MSVEDVLGVVEIGSREGGSIEFGNVMIVVASQGPATLYPRSGRLVAQGQPRAALPAGHHPAHAGGDTGLAAG